MYFDCKVEEGFPVSFENPRDSIESSHEHHDTLAIWRRTLTVGLRYGVQKILNRFIIDVNIGIGIRYRDVRESGLLHPNDTRIQPRHPVISHILTAEGKYFSPNIPIGLKIGYIF